MIIVSSILGAGVLLCIAIYCCKRKSANQNNIQRHGKKKRKEKLNRRKRQRKAVKRSVRIGTNPTTDSPEYLYAKASQPRHSRFKDRSRKILRRSLSLKNRSYRYQSNPVESPMASEFRRRYLLLEQDKSSSKSNKPLYCSNIDQSQELSIKQLKTTNPTSRDRSVSSTKSFSISGQSFPSSVLDNQNQQSQQPKSLIYNEEEALAKSITKYLDNSTAGNSMKTNLDLAQTLHTDNPNDFESSQQEEMYNKSNLEWHHQNQNHSHDEKQ